jgi:hypothetical protein
MSKDTKATAPPLITQMPILSMRMKNKNAVALGRRGGKAKNAKLTEEQRKEMMAEVRKGKGASQNPHPQRTPPEGRMQNY